MRRKKNPSGWAIAGWVLLGLIVIPPLLIGIAGAKAISDSDDNAERIRRNFK